MSLETMSPVRRDAAPPASDGHSSLAGFLTPPEEKRLARELSPKVAWPTLALAVVLPLTYAVIAQLGWERIVPLWACAVVLSIVAYAHYTLVHEAIHDNLVPGHPKLRWLNPLVGWIGALGLGYNWPVLMRGHVLHHSHTNTDQDPDIWVKGGFGALLFRSATYSLRGIFPLTLARPFAPTYYRGTTGLLRGSELLQAEAVSCVLMASLILAIPTGHFNDWLCLLLIPAVTAGILLSVLFQWLPHHPFDRTERYLNARISLWPGAGLFTMQQNYHLIHHLWPSVPFYNYGRFYRRLHPTLVAKGSRIEGLIVGARAKDPVAQ